MLIFQKSNAFNVNQLISKEFSTQIFFNLLFWVSQHCQQVIFCDKTKVIWTKYAKCNLIQFKCNAARDFPC